MNCIVGNQADGISNRWRFGMNPQERLTLLGTRIRKYDIGEDELLRELGKLQPAFDGVEGEATASPLRFRYAGLTLAPARRRFRGAARRSPAQTARIDLLWHSCSLGNRIIN